MAFKFNANAPAFVLNADAPAFVPNFGAGGGSGYGQTWNHPASSSTSTSLPSGSRSQSTVSDSVVATEEELIQIVGQLKNERLLFVDCEGADLSKGSWRKGVLQANGPGLHGRLCLIQIGTVSGEVYAFDVLELGQRTFDLGLRQLLEDPNITKIAHDFRQDSDALFHQFGVSIRSLFDTQLCEVLIRRLNGMRTTYVQGSAKLFANYGIEAQTIPGYGVLTQEQKQRIHDRFSQDRHLWERRPLPQDMIIYAKADVLPLPLLHTALIQALMPLIGDEATANHLVLAGSAAYAATFVELDTCRCRLCCRAEESAKFDGCKVFTRMATSCNQNIWQSLLRPEDACPLAEPGPSRFYINEYDESVPITA